MQKRKLGKFFLIRIFIPLPFSRIIQETLKNFKPHILPFLFNLVINEKSNNPDSSLKHSTNTMHFFLQFYTIQRTKFKGLFINVM